MVKGEAYWNSRQQRWLDKLLTAPGRPVLALARLTLQQVEPRADGQGIFLQPRIGRETNGNRLFVIEKIETLGTNGQPLNWLAALYRKLGIDELAQLANIQRHEMSVFGWRPTVPTNNGKAHVTSYEEIMDNLASSPSLQKRWDYVTRHSPPGAISSYGIYEHTRTGPDPNEFEIRAENDIRDAYDASVLNNVQLLAQFANMALQRRLR